MNYDRDLLDVVMLTIAIDGEVIGKLTKAIAMRAWNVSTFQLDAYISPSRRPSMGPRIRSSAACVAFVDFDRTPEDAAETTRYLTQTFHGKVMIIAVGRNPSSQTILSAMRAGCSEFLSKETLTPTLDSVFDRIDNLHAVEQDQLTKRGAIHALLGAKGGVGTTTLAVHLGVYLAQLHGKRTLLIDQHVELGHACIYLGIDGEGHHLSEVTRNLNRMDSELLQGFVAKHKSGLEILSSPDSHTPSIFYEDEIANTLEFLRGEYDFIIVDCDRSQPELHPVLAHAATQFYVVGTPEIAAIRDLSRTVDKLLVLDNVTEKVQIVVNRFDTPFAITREQVEHVLKLPVSITIPNDFPGLVRSTNVGEPIMPESPHVLATAMTRWADAVAGTEGQRKPRRGERKLLSMWRQTMPAW
jgi:pilus assembly protein CpaE